MSQFEEYLEMKKQQQEKDIDETIIDVDRDLVLNQKLLGLGMNPEAEEDSANFVEESFRMRTAKSTFAERTDYYFKNSEYMDAKTERYLGLADGKELDAYAEKHTNRSAKKRKENAQKAAESFDKVRKLEEKAKRREENPDATPQTPLEVYREREEIMRARMEGMIRAAKVKSTSASNEEYRIAKAKLSCLTLLLDQAGNLRERKSKDFDKIESNLKKEILDARKTLKKYASDADAKWKEALGANDTKKLDKMVKDSGNPYAKREHAELSLLMKSMAVEYTRPEYVEAQKYGEEVFGKAIDFRRDPLFAVTYTIRRDKNGKPINREELKKEQWNLNWLEACKNPKMKYERQRMIIEAYQRMTRIELPTPQELKKHGALYFLKKNPVEIWDLYKMTLRIDNLAGYEPICMEYSLNDKKFKSRMDTAMYFTQVLDYELKENYNLYESKNFEIYPGDQHAGETEEEKAEVMNQKRDNMERSLKAYEDTYGKIKEADDLRAREDEEYRYKKTLSYEKVKEKADQFGNRQFNKESYEKYKQIKESNKALDNPQYRALYAPIHKKLGSDRDISRVCGAMLRSVKFDQNWMPVSEEDMQAHAWNMKYLNNLSTYMLGFELDAMDLREKKELEEEGRTTAEDNKIVRKLEEKKAESEAILKEMVMEEFTRSYSGKGSYPLPTPEQLKKELLEPLKNGQPLDAPCMESVMKDISKYTTMAQKSLCMEGTIKNLPFVQEFVDSHPEFYALQKAQNAFSMMVDAYYNSKYHVSPNTGSNVKVDLAMPLVPETAEFFITQFEEAYNKFRELTGSGQ